MSNPRQVTMSRLMLSLLFFKDESGKTIKRYQFTAIDDATRIRALIIYQKHNQESANNFNDYVLDKFPFRIHTVRTGRGHEFQAKFHWHVEDKGIRHAYIKPRSPQLNGKVERSHRTDQEEFYQLLKYTDDVDLNVKLAKWEEFYKINRPHGAHDGRTPFEELRCLLKLCLFSPGGYGVLQYQNIKTVPVYLPVLGFMLNKPISLY